MKTAAENWQALSAAVYRAFPLKRVAAAVALTLLAHVSAYYAAPETLEMLSRTVVPAKPVELSDADALEKIPENLLPEEFRKRPKFVPVNPEAPTATPKDSENFSAENQRAAQENPDSQADSRTPTNAGETEDSHAISEIALPRELIPPELRQTFAGKNSENSGAENPENDGEKIVENGVDVPVTVSAGTLARGENSAARENGETVSENDVPAPSPRPQISVPVGLKMLTMRSNTAVSEIGTCSLDAKYSEFGDYTQRMLEAIQAAWYIAVGRTKIVQPRAVVIVEFTLKSDGTILDSRVVYSNASQPATYACLDAVESRAPFDPWRADMLAFIGKDSETTRISFHYR